MLSRICNDFIESEGLSYANCAIVTAALENSKLEFYRRVTASYEDEKITENGDIFTV